MLLLRVAVRRLFGRFMTVGDNLKMEKKFQMLDLNNMSLSLLMFFRDYQKLSTNFFVA